MADVSLNFRNAPLPLPPAEYSPEHFRQLIRVLELYFDQQDSWNLQVYNALIGLGMDPFSATSLDAFGRLRVANPYTLFDSQNRYQKDPQFWDDLTGSGTSTYVANESSVDLATTTASGDKVVRQTYRVFPYQPGKSLMVLATFVMNAGKANLRQRVGYFNTSNGVFFQVTNDGATPVKSFVLRTNTSGTPSDTRTVNQADWNGDKLDGTGASGLTLDYTKAQILYMDFEWLGVGSVRCGFIINGTFIVCHTFNNANDIDKVYMTTAILPVRYEIENTGATASASTLTQICSSVISEGGYDQKSKQSWARRTTEVTGINTSFHPLVSIKLANAGAVVLPSTFSFLPTSSDAFEVALIKNADLTGASYNTTEFLNVDYDTTATAMNNSTGTIVQTVYVAASNQATATINQDVGYNFDLQLGTSANGTSDVFTLAARALDGSGNCIASLAFYDLTD